MKTPFSFRILSAILFGIWSVVGTGHAQSTSAPVAVPVHHWNNPPPNPLPAGVTHHDFRSPSMGIDVGYCLYLPPTYTTDTNSRYPVVYWLHGGRGNELTGVPAIAPVADHAMRNGALPPMIIVFINGGAAWHYDNPDTKQMGETSFIKELIPLIDRTCRTFADRDHRAIEGMSMGGRGTTRNIFKYPELFCSAAALTPGVGNERIGVEAGHHLQNNVFSLLEKYAAKPVPPVRFMLIIGTKDQNYPSCLEYMKLLEERQIPFQQVIIDGVSHNNTQYYAHLKTTTLQFHAESFRRAGRQ